MGPSLDVGQQPQPSPQASPIMSALSSQGAKKPGINWLGVLADALAGAAGRPGPYAAMLGQQRQQQQEEQTYQHHKADALDMWRQQQEYEAAHPRAPEPSNYERELTAGGYAPGTPEYQSRMNRHLDAVDDPIVTMTLPGNRVYNGPKSGLAAALGGGNPDATPAVEEGYAYTPGPGGRANKGNWKPAGGQMPSASGTFR